MPLRRILCWCARIVVVMLSVHDVWADGRSWPSSARLSLQAETAVLVSDAFELANSKLELGLDSGNWRFSILASQAHHAVDVHVPGGFLPDATASESQWAGGVTVQWASDDRWVLDASVGLSSGYQDYRSLWLATYYRELFGSFQGYREPDPSGMSWAFGLQHRLRLLEGVVKASLAYRRDHIAPFYEKPLFAPLRSGRDVLESWSGELSLETVPHRRWRVKGSAGLTSTTGRDLRSHGTFESRWALREHLVVKGNIGVTYESPGFHAAEGGLGIEVDWENEWFISLSARFYSDNGLVRDPDFVSSAAPPLDSTQLGIGLRYLHPRLDWALKFGGGVYWTNFAPVGRNSRDFSDLYKDRQWLFGQAGLSVKF